MIIDSKGKVYSKIEFTSEEEVENVIFENFKLLFGDYSILLPKSKISTTGGKATIPDGIIIDFEKAKWYILEVERGVHGAFEHIVPQITKQIVATENADTRSRIIENCLKEIISDPAFKDLLLEIDIPEIKVHGKLLEIVKKKPYVALPIDFVPGDLFDWAQTLGDRVQIWTVEKYSDLKGNVFYSIPAVERDTAGDEVDPKTAESLGDSGGNVITKVVRGGFLPEGTELYFEYAPKGQLKKRFTGVVRLDGIEVEGVVSSPSISSLRCIQKVNPTRTTSNGWTVWKTPDGQVIGQSLKRWAESQVSADRP